MSAMASQITSLMIVYSSIYSGSEQRNIMFHVTSLCEGNSLVTGEFPAQRASYVENVFIWWCHYEKVSLCRCCFIQLYAVLCSAQFLWLCLLSHIKHPYFIIDRDINFNVNGTIAFPFPYYIYLWSEDTWSLHFWIDPIYDGCCSADDTFEDIVARKCVNLYRDVCVILINIDLFKIWILHVRVKQCNQVIA